MKQQFTVALFDLDGVLVDTARYHYQAWKEIALQLALDFTPQHNELLKGVSRVAAMDIVERLSGQSISDPKKLLLAQDKNNRYLELIHDLTPEELLPGVLPCLQRLRAGGIKIGLGSASKNAQPVLEMLGIAPLFDAVVDGTKVEKAKPDPEVFLTGATLCNAQPSQCVVFEDAIAGVTAAKAGGMYAVGVGDPKVLHMADLIVQQLDLPVIYRLFGLEENKK